MQTLPEQLRLATDALAGLSHEQIAAALSLGGGRQRITAMLAGRRPVRPEHIVQLAALLRSRARAMFDAADALDGRTTKHARDQTTSRNQPILQPQKDV